MARFYVPLSIKIGIYLVAAQGRFVREFNQQGKILDILSEKHGI